MSSYRYSFISHAHADNALCDPYATAFGRLGVPHYYDRANPQIGHDIGEALERELLAAQALIILVSPQALASPWVREEINIYFALMMREPGRLLIPIKVEACELPPRLEARWWVDGVGRPAAEVVAEVARALDLEAPTPSTAAQTDAAAPAEKRERTVDAAGGGDHTTIQEAIAAASPGEKILIRAGVYEEALVIIKPLELIGEGRVELHAIEDENIPAAITFVADHGIIRNLVIRQSGARSGVTIGKGRLTLESCDISAGGDGIFVTNEAEPYVSKCLFHDSRTGASFANSSKGTMEDCLLFSNTQYGLAVQSWSTPTVRRCTIRKNQFGVLVLGLAQGLLERCDIYDNQIHGVDVDQGSAPTVRRCAIYQNGGNGIYIGGKSSGIYEENNLHDNTEGSWRIYDDSKDLITRQRNID